MSFFEELKRRNVVRVGIAYAVGAWLLLQFTEVLSELLSLPSTVGPVVVALVAIGLPVALFMAWAYELTPEGVKRESEVDRSGSITPSTGRKLNGLIMALLALAVIVLLLDKFLFRERVGAPPVADTVVGANSAAGADDGAAAGDTATRGNEPAANTGTDAPLPVEPRSIAVLPFSNRSPVSEDEFFIDGIHDDLLTNLARLGDLKVISRTSVSRFRDTEAAIPDIARQLNVATIMQGAVQRAGDRVRINVQLIDARSDEHLWAETYDRELNTDNLFSIQSEIAGAIAGALQAELTPEEAERLDDRPTENLAAYSAYLRGLRAFERRQIDSMETALAEFRRAAELDPQFPHAWAGIAWVASVLPSWGGLSIEEGREIAMPAAKRALELAPGLGESLLAMAVALTDDRDRSLSYFEKALEAMPNHAQAWQWYGNQLQELRGREAEALDAIKRAASLDPLSPLFRHQVGRQYVFMGRLAEAEGVFRQLVFTDPGFFPGVSFMALVSEAQGRLAESVSWLRRSRELDKSSPFTTLNRLFIFYHLEEPERIEALRAEAVAIEQDLGAPLQAWLDAMLALDDGRPAAAAEIMAGIRDIPFFPEIDEWVAGLQMMDRNYPAARSSLERAQPGFFDPQLRRQTLIEKTEIACLTGYVMIRTGNEGDGRALVEETIEYVNTDLAAREQHVSVRNRLQDCYAIAGDRERMLEVLNRHADHGHLAWWRLREMLEFYDPYRGDPDFDAVQERFRAAIERERQALAALDVSGSGP